MLFKQYLITGVRENYNLLKDIADCRKDNFKGSVLIKGYMRVFENQNYGLEIVFRMKVGGKRHI